MGKVKELRLLSQSYIGTSGTPPHRLPEPEFGMR
jgi:hypothetical protein